jgi:hypothetical protein
MVAIYTLWHNWVHIRGVARDITMEAKLTDHVWSYRISSK